MKTIIACKFDEPRLILRQDRLRLWLLYHEVRVEFGEEMKEETIESMDMNLFQETIESLNEGF